MKRNTRRVFMRGAIGAPALLSGMGMANGARRHAQHLRWRVLAQFWCGVACAHVGACVASSCEASWKTIRQAPMEQQLQGKPNMTQPHEAVTNKQRITKVTLVPPSIWS